MMPSKIGFIGLGHIGGSVAKTIHRLHPDITLIAFDTCQETLDTAQKDGVIAKGFSSVTNDFFSCDYIYLCAPVLKNPDYLPVLKNFTRLNPNLLITDVGSVKNEIHEKITAYDLEANFIGGHPMCGTEHTGYAYSTAYMLENAYYLLTPTKKISAQKVQEFETFTRSLDTLTMVLDVRTHDFTVGSVSHLPHVISATLVNLVRELDDEQETMKTVAAGGFKDITRISSSSPVMWENICLANKSQILNLIDRYIAAMGQIRTKIEQQNGSQINHFFQQAKDYRDSFQIPASGPIRPVYNLFCDLIDEAGGIATIATILSSNNISIKNIGIIHNREFEQGVLHIEFYDETSLLRAAELLKKYHYTVYTR